MKGTISCFVFVAVIVQLPSSVFAQAWFALQNHSTLYGIDAPVFDSSGAPLASPNIVAELWGGVTPESLTPALRAYNLQRAFAPFGPDRVHPTGGYFADAAAGGSAGFPTIFSVPAHAQAWLQVRAWDTRLGATYEDVVAAGLGGYGESPLFSAVGSDPFSVPPDAPAPLRGLQSFSLRAEVPEPSTWRLFGLGAIGLWWATRNRSKQRSP